MQSLHEDHHSRQTGSITGNGHVNGNFRSELDGSVIIENGPTTISETDFCVNEESPSKPIVMGVKRVYVCDGKVTKNQLTPVKAGLFQVLRYFQSILTQLAL